MHFSRFYTDRRIERHISWRCSLYLVKLVCWCESVPAGSLPDHNRVITEGQTHCVFGRVSVENKLVWMSGRWTCQSILADLKSSSKDRDVLPSMLQSMCTCNVLWNTLNVKFCIYWQKDKLLQIFIHILKNHHIFSEIYIIYLSSSYINKIYWTDVLSKCAIYCIL